MRRFTLMLLALLLITACGGGGGGGDQPPASPPDPGNPNLRLQLPTPGLRPEQLAIIVARGDAVSEAMAADYQRARGVPDANVVRVSINTAAAVVDAASFATLRAEIEAQLPAGVQASLLAWNSPSRVAGPTCSMGITSAMALGYDAKYCVGGNLCRVTATSPLYDSESRRPFAELGVRPAMLLARDSVAAARSLIDRGLSAEASMPPGTGYLVRSSDALRSVRYTDYGGLPAGWSGSLSLNYIDNSAATGSDSIGDASGVLFYFTGLSQVPDLGRVAFRAGALADHLTSFGGQLPGGNGQMPITAWLDAGASASHGTVEEPCNLPQKFSRAAVLIDRYWRGETAIEAYWKSVEQPGQGLFVGDPLARPFGQPSSLTVEGQRYRLRSRALRPGASYTLEYRIGSGGSWTELARFTGQLGKVLDDTAPLAPAAATELRWRGPCPQNNGQSCTLAASSD